MKSDSARVLTVTCTDLLDGLRNPENRTVWRDYVDRYRPVLLAYARRLGLGEADAEDLAQQTLLTFSTAYREGRYDRERGRLRAWLFGIAQNHLRHLRRRRPDATLGTDEALALEDPGDQEALFDQEWRDGLLRQGLEVVRREVTPQTFEAFQLFASQDWPAERVAAHLGITPNAVFGAKRRVLQRLRELLPALEEDW